MKGLQRRLEIAAKAGEVVRIIYHGGSQPGTVREISPIRVATLEILARDLATDIVKTFKLAKIELVEDATDAPEYVSHPDVPEPAGIIEALDGKRPELENLGWHVTFSEDEASVYRFFKNGKPRKTPDVSLSYDEFVIDLFVDDDGELHEDARHSTRPYRVDSLRFASGRMFGKLSRAAALFLEEAHALKSPDATDESSGESPSERQLKYARDLGVVVPVGATKGRVSELIQATLDQKDAEKLPDELIAEADPEGRSGCLSLVAFACLVAVIVFASLLWW